MLETKLLAAMFTDDWEALSDSQINESLFKGNIKRAYNWITEFKIKYNKVPSIEEFNNKFPEVNLEVATEPLKYYCHELRKKIKHNLMVDTIEKVQQEINSLDTEEAYKSLVNLVTRVEEQEANKDTCLLGENTEDRFNRYLERGTNNGISGITTGILPIDRQTGGIKPIDLMTILGFTGTGKSFFLCLLAVNMAKAGYKVLFLTKEMVTYQLIDRIDAIWCGISYNGLKRGKLTAKEEKIYKEYLAGVSRNYKDSIVLELVDGGVIKCASFISKHSPDIVLVDGAYLMADDEKDDDWKGVLNVWRKLKGLARNNKTPIIATTQLKDEKATLQNAAFAKQIASECDVVYGIQQDEVMKVSKEIDIVTLKVRDGEWQPAFRMNWDFDKMDTSLLYISEETSNKAVEYPKLKTLDD